MKREFLKAIEGLTDEAIDKIMAENGKDIEAEKAKTNAYKTEVDTLKADKKQLEDKISELTEKASSNDDYKSQLEALQKEIRDKEAAAQKEAEEQALTDAIVEVFGDAKFTSDYVRNGLIADMKAEIQKPENKGKGYADIYKALTENKTGIFENPNPPAPMPGMGDIGNDMKKLEDLGMADYIAARKNMKG